MNRIVVYHCLKTITGIILMAGLSASYARSQIQTDVPALREVYAHDFSIGCLLSYRHVGFATDPPVPGQSTVVDPNGGYLIKFHMNSMSPGNNMKMQYTVDLNASAAAYNAAPPGPIRDSIEAHPIIAFNGDMIAQLNWAQRQGFTFRGHTLVWHSQAPTAFFRSGYASGGTRLTRDVMIERMRNYIYGIIRVIHESWPGVLSAFDVVNESVNDNGTFRTAGNEWYTTIGDTTYVMTAFAFARAATAQYGESQIHLYYNDYSTHLAAKADGIVRLCTPIFQAGLLDGIGMQEHDANATPTAAAWIASYNKFAPICSEMAVTEFDVATGSANPPAAVLATQANQYGQLFKCFVERSYRSGRGRIISVSKDGLNDVYTFQTNQSSSLWDGQDQCKPSFYAAANVGLHYNALDSLLTVADSLHESDYTPSSWAGFVPVRTLARTARDINYSNTVSADTALGGAHDTLASAMTALVLTGVDDHTNETPGAFALRQNYPNPFNPTTRITYSIPLRAFVSLRVFDILGREVALLQEGLQHAGTHDVAFDGTGLTSGVYFYRLQSGDRSETKRLVLLK